MADKKQSTLGLYFSMDQESANTLRARLNEIASRYGYIATRGATTGQGNLSELLLAIDAGEIAVVMMSDEIKALMPWLETQPEALLASNTLADAMISEGINALSKQLAEAREREAEAYDEIFSVEPKSQRDIAIRLIERGLHLLKESDQA